MKNTIKNLVFILSIGFLWSPAIINAQIIPFSGAPDIISSSVSNITTNSVTLNGIVNANNVNTSITYELSNGDKYPIKKIFTGNVDTTLNPYNLTNLQNGTNYSFRIKAVNSIGTNYGQWISFTTAFVNNPGGNNIILPATTSPSIISVSISNITTNSATINAVLKANGLSTNAYYEDSNGKIYQIKKSFSGFTNSNLDPLNLSQLNVNTNYSFRLVATNSFGTTYGSWTNFKTNANNNGGGNSGGGGSSGGGYVYVVPSTLTASSVNTNSAILNGNVITHNLKTEAWFEYGTLNNISYFTSTTKMNVNSNSTNTPFSLSVNNLNPNTIYYFRAVAKGPSGTKYGSVLSFKTSAIQSSPIINTKPIINNKVEIENENLIEDNSIILEENSDYLFPDEDRNSANVLSAYGLGNLFPSTFTGWIILFLLLLAIFILFFEVRKTFRKKSKEKSADHVDNLPI